VDRTLRLIQHNWVVLAYNFNIVIFCANNWRVKYSCISAYHFITVYPCYYLPLSFYPCTCWVPTISVLNLAIFPCYSNLLLRRRRWTGILRWRVLGYVLRQLPFLWSYRVFRCFASLRVIVVFRDITYVIIILYSQHSVISEHFWPCAWNNWSWVMHTDGDPWGLNLDLSVETKDNSIGEESQRSWHDYNRPGTLCLSNWYTKSHGRRDLVEHDNPAMRAPVLQAIEELARTSRTSTKFWDEYEK
jgi:hypothetical protein